MNAGITGIPEYRNICAAPVYIDNQQEKNKKKTAARHCHVDE